MESIPVCCFSVFWNIGGNNEIVLGHRLDTVKAGCICCIFTVFLNNRAFTSAVLSVTFWGMTQSVAVDCSRSRLTDRWVSASLCLANTDGTVCEATRGRAATRRVHPHPSDELSGMKREHFGIKDRANGRGKDVSEGERSSDWAGLKKELFIRHWGRDWGGTCYRREMENRHG